MNEILDYKEFIINLLIYLGFGFGFVIYLNILYKNIINFLYNFN